MWPFECVAQSSHDWSALRVVRPKDPGEASTSRYYFHESDQKKVQSRMDKEPYCAVDISVFLLPVSGSKEIWYVT